MGIWERLGNVIKSYLSDDDKGSIGGTTSFGENDPAGSGSAEYGRRDPDFDAAYEELNDYLRGTGAAEKGGGKETSGKRIRPVPAELRADFAELGLTPEASAEECKEAYKKFLKNYHPDRHAGNAEAMKMATEKTATVNAAYDRLEKWFRTG